MVAYVLIGVIAVSVVGVVLGLASAWSWPRERALYAVKHKRKRKFLSLARLNFRCVDSMDDASSSLVYRLVTVRRHGRYMLCVVERDAKFDTPEIIDHFASVGTFILVPILEFLLPFGNKLGLVQRDWENVKIMLKESMAAFEAEREVARIQNEL